MKLAYWPETENVRSARELANGMYLPLSYLRMLLEDDSTRGTCKRSSMNTSSTTTSTGRTGPGTCGHQITTRAPRHRPQAWQQHGYGAGKSSAG